MSQVWCVLAVGDGSWRGDVCARNVVVLFVDSECF